VRLTGGCDLPFLHRLEERRLRLRRGAVDLVGKDDVREDRPLHEAEDPLSGRAVLLDDFGAGDVGRHQIRGELDPAEVEIEGLGHRRDEEGLGESGHADQESVPVGEESSEDALHHVVLSDDPLFDFAAQSVGHLGDALEEAFVRVRRHHVLRCRHRQLSRGGKEAPKLLLSNRESQAFMRRLRGTCTPFSEASPGCAIALVHYFTSVILGWLRRNDSEGS